MDKKKPWRDHQVISVPYLWEEKPGKPKKNWISAPVSLVSLPSPARLIVSVPFLWEEKPGTPLVQFPQSPLYPTPALDQSSFPNPPTPFYSPISSLTPPHAIHTTYKNPFLDDEEDGLLSGYDIETFNFNMSLNLDALPARNTNPFLDSAPEAGYTHKESWLSFSEGDHHSNSSSSTTQKSTNDSSAIEFHFPLFSPDAGFLKKVLGEDRSVNSDYQEILPKCSHRSTASMATGKSMTLEELILLSRKLSYRVRPVDEKKQNSRMIKDVEEFVGKKVLACFPFIKTGYKATNPLIRSK